MAAQSRKRISLFVAAMLLGSVITIAVLYSTQMLAFQANGEFKKLESFYQVLNQHYVDPVETDTLVDGAITGMIQALEDPYTSYLTKEESESFFENIQNEFEGIGAEVREVEGQTMIVSPIKNSPAEAAGLKPNDIILKVGDIDLTGMKIDESVNHIRGPKGSEVILTIQRPGVEEPFEVKIVRDTIPLESVFTKMVDEDMGVIQISKFSETTSGEFEKALEEVQSKGAKGIILDLRQNPGGLLSEVVAMTEKFVPKGELVLQVRYRDGSTDTYQSQSEPLDVPIVVLIDGGSASASEIMAGALKESAGIPLIGVKTFGKGTVQTPTTYEDGSTLKYTTAEWLTPKGNQIHEKGIEPDIKVELPDYANLPYIVVEEPFEQGDIATEIETAQKYLEALGYTPGRTDGIFDQATKEAIISFQEKVEMTVSGQLTSETVTNMALELRELIQQNDTQLERAKDELRQRLQS